MKRYVDQTSVLFLVVCKNAAIRKARKLSCVHIKTRNYMNFALRVLVITYQKYYLVLEISGENKTHGSIEGIYTCIFGQC